MTKKERTFWAKLIHIPGTDNVIVKQKGYPDLVKQLGSNTGIGLETLLGARHRIYEKRKRRR